MLRESGNKSLSASQCGQLSVCDSRIGNVLAYAPEDPDGRWPCEPVRKLIENLHSEKLEEGLEIGIHNKRGVHWRAKGGGQERMLAAKFRSFAEDVRSKWPRTAAVLKRTAESYEREARREDERDSIQEFE